jgi:hypothetical protein
MENQAKEQFVYVQDLALAAAMLCYGFRVSHIQSDDNHKFQFAITNDENLGAVIEAYWSDALSVNPKTYFYMLRDLKNRMFEKRRSSI